MLRLLSTILLAVGSSVTAYSYLPAGIDLVSNLDNSIKPDDLTAARWVTGHDDLRNVFDRCVTTRGKMPHIHKKLQLYWGYPEFLTMSTA